MAKTRKQSREQTPQKTRQKSRQDTSKETRDTKGGEKSRAVTRTSKKRSREEAGIEPIAEVEGSRRRHPVDEDEATSKVRVWKVARHTSLMYLMILGWLSEDQTRESVEIESKERAIWISATETESDKKNSKEEAGYRVWRRDEGGSSRREEAVWRLHRCSQWKKPRGLDWWKEGLQEKWRVL